MRDIVLGETFYMDFTTRQFSDGVPTVLSNSPVLSVLEENNATPITGGVSVTVDRASVVGLNMATIVATGGNGYEAGKGYSIYISTGTVGGVSVIGEVVGQFTIAASAAAQDLANGTDGLGTIKAVSDLIVIDTAEIGTAGVGLSNINLPNQTMNIVGNITGNLSGSVGSVTAGVTLAADAITSAKIADGAFLGVNFAAGSLDGKGDWNLGKTGYSLTTADWNVGKTGYSLTTADWNVGKTGYSLTTAPLTAAEVNTQCDLALSDINLDHWVGTATAIPALPTGTYLDLLQDDGTATYSRTTDSMQAIRDHATTIKTATDAIPTTVMRGTDDAATAVNLSTVNTVVDGIQTDLSNGVDGLGALKTLIDALNDISNANVLTQINAALDTAIVELGVAAPTATPTIRTGLMLLYMALRNLRSTTASADIITNDAGTTIASATVSDDAVTFTKTEYS